MCYSFFLFFLVVLVIPNWITCWCDTSFLSGSLSGFGPRAESGAPNETKQELKIVSITYYLLCILTSFWVMRPTERRSKYFFGLFSTFFVDFTLFGWFFIQKQEKHLKNSRLYSDMASILSPWVFIAFVLTYFS